MKNKLSLQIKFISIIIILSAAVSACADGQGIQLGKPEPTVTPIPEQPVTIQRPTYEVQRGTIVQIRTFTGHLGPVSSTPISFDAEGRIGEVFFYEGDMVEEGDLIATFDYLGDLEKETTLREMSLRRAEIAVERAQLYLDMVTEQPYASESDIQLKTWDLELAELAYQELMISFGEQLATVESAKLIAPISGMITDSDVRIGKNVSASDDVITISDISKLSILVDSYSLKVEEVKEGMVVTINVYNSGEESYTGTIRQMPYPYGTGPARDIDKYIYIEFDNPQDAEKFEINDRFDITVEIDRAEDVLWLPPAAIREFSGRTFVMVQDGDIQQSIDVGIGLSNGEMTEITEGLEEGLIVVGQ